ncbi:hypothetical protein A2630_04270 [Candidatus Woesebacteria bacterium RIFCSPHIGHO2_01_FULL_44_10]|uniref:Putative pre-16S rRNA nuclease n=1 Tax=Candidatus Woesebacteria bacterium RIFCSPLOWO2_01_FULL_44_14 TaxID=1802525 RepID=A0A1F8C1Z9_9BACT|nr:MAG: hypothetical protein A2630_04270 [Candidatus Woesebacteria bacterium RIFCSPHIGHO2_01_FULL_44_10]OGM54681.1 MAG: hypothetical protein A3F62_02645 [Candidatus Woesebacteria bacterium RIFCSPHIGHO2_12_FULL_44_11]OGM70150.1 MAG: hypothetical protein A2975_03685 [Candidatus Woesebacteria bacterium RIFCSPLOWO2_01_FULL_44_14]
MRLLGIDWGRKKTGLALAEANLATPLAVVPTDRLLEKVGQVVKVEKVDKIVIGVSENESALAAREFGKNLAKEIDIPVDYHDETLTTADARALSISAGISRKKRKNMEDAFAATIMLQSYLDNA